VHRRHHRLGQRHDRPDGPVGGIEHRIDADLRLLRLIVLADPGSRAESAPGPAEPHHLDLRVVGRPLQGVGQTVEHLGGQGIQTVRPVQRHRQNAVVEFHGEVVDARHGFTFA
jgi:hypothetical protein